MPRAYLGLGSNLGDRLGYLQRAVDLLDAEPGLEIAMCSRVWETDPVGPPQPNFLNVVLAVDVSLDPVGLLALCQRIETTLHRERTSHWGPRTIDIDILLIGDVVIASPTLTVPHPRSMERAFVVLPLMELAPGLVLPDGTALRNAQVSGGARPFAPPLAADRA